MKKAAWKWFESPSLPHYLVRHYWWAYIWKFGIWLCDHNVLINLYLFRQYKPLSKMTVELLGQEDPGKILQLTSVYGNLSQDIVKSHPDHEFHIIDIVRNQLNVARKKMSRCHVPRNNYMLSQMNAENLAIADSSFDTVVVFFLLHEMPEAARERTIKEAIRVTKPHGRILIADYAGIGTNHPIRKIPGLTKLIHSLEPFLADFISKELLQTITNCCALSYKNIRLIDQRYFFKQFYQVISLRVEIAQ